MGCIGSPEGSECHQIVRTKFKESYSIGFHHFKVIWSQKMVKNQPKLAENTLKSLKSGSTHWTDHGLTPNDLIVVKTNWIWFLQLSSHYMKTFRSFRSIYTQTSYCFCILTEGSVPNFGRPNFGTPIRNLRKVPCDPFLRHQRSFLLFFQ